MLCAFRNSLINKQSSIGENRVCDWALATKQADSANPASFRLSSLYNSYQIAPKRNLGVLLDKAYSVDKADAKHEN